MMTPSPAISGKSFPVTTRRSPHLPGIGTCGAAGELPYASVLDLAHPVSIGSYMNEPDVINNRYQLHLAMEAARNKLPELFTEYAALSGRELSLCGAYRHEDAEVLLFVLGSSYHTAMEAVDRLRQDGVAAGVITLYVLRPFPAKELRVLCHNAFTILVADRQDSYGAGGGNMSLELKAALSSLPPPAAPFKPDLRSRRQGLFRGGRPCPL